MRIDRSGRGGGSVDRQEREGRRRVGTDRGSGRGESRNRQKWGTRGGVGWERKRVGIDRKGSGVGGGESGDRQVEWDGRGKWG